MLCYREDDRVARHSFVGDKISAEGKRLSIVTVGSGWSATNPIQSGTT
jgi:hypothetical protein